MYKIGLKRLFYSIYVGRCGRCNWHVLGIIWGSSFYTVFAIYLAILLKANLSSGIKLHKQGRHAEATCLQY